MIQSLNIVFRRVFGQAGPSGAECDLLLERDGQFFPIEIKANSNPSRKDARGIELSKAAYPNLNIQKGLIIAPTKTVYAVTKDVIVVPWDLS